MKQLLVFLIILQVFILFGENEVYQNYIKIIGEGPVGPHLIADEGVFYTRNDGEEFAKKEISLYMSGMIYGYTFEYQLENPITKRKDFFELKPRVLLSVKDPHLTYYQYEISNISIRLTGIYSLNEDQKVYINDFKSSLAVTSTGDTNEYNSQDWNLRYNAFEISVKNAIFNYAKSYLKSRPQYLRGKLILKESPKFYIVSGGWRVKTKINLIIQEIKYQDSY